MTTTDTPTLIQRLGAEALGTALLLIGVVGSGIMAETLSPDNIGVALLANAVATGAVLYVLITTLGPVSGAHFNPAVTLAFLLRREIELRPAVLYIGVQIAGGIVGVWLAHLMFEQSILQSSTTIRSGSAQFSSEVIACFGLVFTIFAGLKTAPAQVPALVAAYITGAYWFTSSTSFANPAVTIARSFTDTFAGIAPSDVLPFIIAQLIGAVIATFVARALFSKG